MTIGRISVLAWSGCPPSRTGGLASLARLLVPYRRDETVEDGIRLTREVLRATVSLARSRGATPLVVVPQFGVEEPVERALRGRILDETDVPYAFVEIDSALAPAVGSTSESTRRSYPRGCGRRTTASDYRPVMSRS